jgi:hypothetical protein
MSSHSLVDRLPPEVSRRSAFVLTRYLNYPVFTWPWFWRRSALFALLPLAYASMGTANVVLLTSDRSLAFGYAWRGILAMLLVVTLGPLLGTWVRHARTKITIERVALIAVILLSIALGVLSLRSFGAYYDTEVRPAFAQQIEISEQAKKIGARDGVRVTNLALLIAFVAAVGGGFALRAYFTETRRLREYSQQKEMLRLREARDNADRQLAVLQAQIEPHFLYNTLASVRSLVPTDPSRAVATIDALVDHLRTTLPKFRDGHNARATLREQIDICRSYLDVMCIRMGGRLTYSVDVSVDLAQVPFPPLMLITLVENAIKHGVEPKPGPCTISITARFADAKSEDVEVLVADDGVGLREGPSGGLGLANIRAQLAARYGQRATLELMGGARGGTVAKLTLPLES